MWARRCPVAHVLKADPARLVVCRISADNLRDSEILRDLGFVEVEQLVTFEREIGNESEALSSSAPEMQAAAEACADLARRSFRYDRFHADPVMPCRLADEIKAASGSKQCSRPCRPMLRGVSQRRDLASANAALPMTVQ